MQAGAMGSGICGNAVTRAADAMLRSLGGEEISLLSPLTAMPDANLAVKPSPSLCGL